MRMGRHPDPKPRRMRADWVYTGALEASCLAGVSQHTLQRWVAAGELVGVRVAATVYGGRPRTLYRLSDVLWLGENRGR